MDELQLLREYFDDRPPPAPDVVAAAKARLSRGEPPRRSRRPSRRTLLRIGLPAAAIAASAAVFTAIAVQPDRPQVQLSDTGVQAFGSGPALFRLPGGATGGPPGTTATGRDILLSAARTVARAPEPATGRYWETLGLVGNFLRVGPANDRYVINEKVAVQQWAAQSPRIFSFDTTQALGVQFASAADQEAWRRDGAPTTLKGIGQYDSLASPQGFASGSLRPITTAPGRPENGGAWVGGPPFQIGNDFLFLHGLLALPADPARLKALLMTDYASSDYDSPTSYLFQATPAVLEEPVTPAVRSALYRMLAALPGVRSLGVVQDVAGQRGVGVAVSRSWPECGQEMRLSQKMVSSEATFSSCVVQQSLIINPATGLPLAEELSYVKLPAGQSWPAPGGLFSYEVFTGAHWTNTAPRS
jgi:hypothetical protein